MEAPMIRAASLSSLAGIQHGFFTRRGGVSDGVYASLNGGTGSRDVPLRVAENRARMAAAIGVEASHLITPYQIHTPDAVIVEKPWTVDARPKADAVVTKVPGLAISVSTADCGPILFADRSAGVIGAAHAGWRGALAGVVEATLVAMEKCGADRNRIRAALGPMIRQPNYEVGSEFVARFEAAGSDNARFFRASPTADRALFDLAGFIAARLAAAGVGEIDDTGRCTYADPETFFSYRRSVHRAEPDYGRHINAIALSA
jgi:YfiH family protein